jgi:hypothetical protein
MPTETEEIADVHETHVIDDIPGMEIECIKCHACSCCDPENLEAVCDVVV